MSTESCSPHHVPDWIAHWTAPDLLTAEEAISHLMQLHGALLGEVTHGRSRDVYLHAAGLVNKALIATDSASVLRAGEPVLTPISEFMNELIRVLQDQHYDAGKSALCGAFGLASGWVDHVGRQADHVRTLSRS